MKRLLKSIVGGERPRHIATIRRGRAKRTLSAVRYRKTGNAHQRPAVAEIGNNPMQQQVFATAPLLEMAGVENFHIRWPSDADVIAIGLSLSEDGNVNREPRRLFAALLEHLAGLDPATARRLVLAHLDAVAAMFGYAFREMRAGLPADDPRLAERLPAILERGAA